LRFNQWKENKYGKDLRAVELADGRARVEAAAETTQEEDLKNDQDGNRRYRLCTLKVNEKG
jgi:hypothetical protein